MSIWALLGIICGCGAVGGILNAIFSDDRGLALPKTVPVGGSSVWRPGFVGNIFVGAVAAGVFWMLYGRYHEAVVIGASPEEILGAAQKRGEYGETLAALGGAVLAGIGGARLLTNLVDKKFFQAAASEAAQKPADAEAAQQLATASPLRAAELVEEMPA
jgi:hypothetical protein